MRSSCLQTSRPRLHLKKGPALNLTTLRFLLEHSGEGPPKKLVSLIIFQAKVGNWF